MRRDPALHLRKDRCAFLPVHLHVLRAYVQR
jgi:hypothetical protein